MRDRVTAVVMILFTFIFAAMIFQKACGRDAILSAAQSACDKEGRELSSTRDGPFNTVQYTCGAKKKIRSMKQP